MAGRNRRSEQVRKRRVKRRRRNRLLFTIVCVILIAAVVILAPTVFFRVSNVNVVGETRYKQQDLIDTSGVHTGDNMFFLDSGHISDMLYEAYPYLETVTLHRKLPSTLQIEVSDRIAAVSIVSGNDYLLMDLSGKILEKTRIEAADTVIVTGINTKGLKVGDTINDKQEKLTTVLNLIDLMMQYGLEEDMKSIDMRKAYDVSMEYGGKYLVLLGDLNELEHKIQFLQAILKEPSLPDNSIIDLTDDKEARYRPMDDVRSNSNPEEDEENTEDTDA